MGIGDDYALGVPTGSEEALVIMYVVRDGAVGHGRRGQEAVQESDIAQIPYIVGVHGAQRFFIGGKEGRTVVGEPAVMGKAGAGHLGGQQARSRFAADIRHGEKAIIDICRPQRIPAGIAIVGVAWVGEAEQLGQARFGSDVVQDYAAVV